jgi:uncharacterized protein (TIGR00299 family) protein
MFLGALVDGGVDLAALEGQLAGLGVSGWTLSQSERTDSRLGGTKVDVLLGEGHDDVHRHLGDILAIIDAATGLSPWVRSTATKVFTVLAEAEATVHGTTVSAVHFHEVGAVDAIIDVTGTLIGLELLGVRSLSCAPIPLGSGMVKCAHGTIPVPVPATLELLRGLPTVPAEGVHPTGELVTPTGAALVRVLCDRFGPPPPMKLDRVAHGLGTRERKDVPNVLRIFFGTVVDAEAQAVDVLTATIDDMDSRLFGPLAERLLADGALDVTLRPVYGKKGRPAIEVIVLSLPDRAARELLQVRMFRETTTLGLRWRREHRTTLERRFREVETEFGVITVKEGFLDGETNTAQPEFDSVVAAADVHDVPVRRVLDAVRAVLGEEALRLAAMRSDE